MMRMMTYLVTLLRKELPHYNITLSVSRGRRVEGPGFESC